MLGAHDTPESRAAYDRLVAEWIAAGRQRPPGQTAAAAGPTVSVIIAAFMRHAATYYRHPDGTEARELDNYRLALRPLRRLYGPTPAAEFGPLKLRALMLELGKLGWCRKHINRQIGRVKQCFKWAAAAELLPGGLYADLAAVDGLRAGRCEARESEAVRPAPQHILDAVLPLLSPIVRAMAELQLLTGMRPAEVCLMRGVDLDTTTDPAAWDYRPQRHKTEHHGHERVITLGTRAREVLTPFLRPDLSAYLFSPAESEAWRRQLQRQKRKTKIQPSQVLRAEQAAARAPRRKRGPGDRYDVAAYRRAIVRACATAFPPPDHLAQRTGETPAQWHKRLTKEQRAELTAWTDAHSFHPHQLRHNAATELRRRYGIEAARLVLGHRSVAVTAQYAEADQEKARRIMIECG